MQARVSMERGVKDYLSSSDRFAQRMRSSLRKVDEVGEGNAIEG